MKPMNISLFEEGWQKVEDDVSQQPLLDWDNAKYKEWTSSNNEFVQGMRHELTDRPHGIARQTWSDSSGEGNIVEGSYKFGDNHGVFRMIKPNEVKVFVAKANTIKAYFKFNSTFDEIKRSDDKNMLGNWTAEMFKLNDDEKLEAS